MVKILRKYRHSFIFFIVFLVLIILIYITIPDKNILGSYSVSIENITASQRRNVCLAASKINNKYIYPQEEFSFNSVVGPRNMETGFVLAHSLYEGEVLNTLGGGVCLVSSALYNAVLRTCLKIKERVPHKNIVRSVPIGLDATVWYGVNDFKFINNTDHKIKIEAGCDINNLNVIIKGNSSKCEPKVTVKKENIGPHKIKVSTFREINFLRECLSSDIYVY